MSDWKTVKLGDIYNIGSSKRVLKSEWRDIGIPFYRGREITSLSKEGFVDNKLFISSEHYEELIKKYGVPIENDILITAIGTIGSSYIVQQSDKFYFKDGSVLWLQKKTDILSEYVNYWIKSQLFKSQLDKGNGATVDTLTISKLTNLSLSLPPLPEQQRIVAKLDAAFTEIDTAIATTEKKQEEINKLKQTILTNALHPQTPPAKMWETMKLGDFALINYGYTTKANHGSGTYKILRITDIQDGFVNWNTVPFCEVGTNKLKNYLLYDGDIVFARTGATTGKSFLVKNPVNAVFASYLIRLSVNKDIIMPEFIFYFFQSKKYWEQIREGISGAAQGGFNASKLTNISLRLPPLLEQQRIVAKLDTAFTEIDNFTQATKKKIANHKALKSAILTQELQPKNKNQVA